MLFEELGTAVEEDGAERLGVLGGVVVLEVGLRAVWELHAKREREM